MAMMEQQLDLNGLRDFCARLVPQLQAGDNLLLHGPMGSGKTQFVQFLVQELGSDDTVTSPTYGLANFYDTSTMPVLHIDTYRLQNAAEYHQLGLDEFYDSHLTLVEWGDKVAADFDDTLNVSFAILVDGKTEVEESLDMNSDLIQSPRAVTFEWTAPRWGPVLQSVMEQTK